MKRKNQRYVGPIEGRKLIFEYEEYGKDEFCCIDMNLHIHEKEEIMGYHKPSRSYVIKVGEFTTQEIKFCPWCGTKLPKELLDEWYDILEKEYNITDPLGDERSKVPTEFKTDEWWKKRRL